MFFQYLIISLSILCTTTGQETSEAPSTTESEISDGTPDTSESPREAVGTPIGCGNGTKWHCSNDECIEIDKKCDGVFDCEDASDEYLETCRNEEPRQMFGLILHCSSFWNPMHDSVCPQICKKSPEFCYYALMAENKEKNTCFLPNYPTNGTYKIMPTNQTDAWGRLNFWLMYHCEAPQVVNQTELISCIDGNWKSDPNNVTCIDACALNKNSNFTYKCLEDVYGSTECGDYVAIKTTVSVSRATQDKDNPASNASLEILCSEDNNKFHINTECVSEVDRMQQNFERPTMAKMSDFESKFNEFKSNDTSPAFQGLVNKYHDFEAEVRGNLTLMHTMAEKCDISLDFLLYDLQRSKEEEPTE